MKSDIKFYTQKNHPRPAVDFEGVESLARQEFRDESDINNIIKRYQATGVLVDPLKINHERKPMFGDYSEVPDLARAYDMVAEAQMRYQELPYEVRRRFPNPVAFYDFVSNPDNRQECERLGLLAKPIIAKTAEAVNPEPPKEAAKGANAPVETPTR